MQNEDTSRYNGAAVENEMTMGKRNKTARGFTGAEKPRSCQAMNRFSCALTAICLLLVCRNAYCQSDPKTLFEAGVEKFKSGSYQDAVDLFSNVIVTTPENAKAYKNRGVALMNLGKLDSAISDFSKAIELDPDLGGVYSNLGAAWHYKGEYDKAIMNYDRAIADEPQRALFYYNRAISKMRSNDLTGAIADFEKTLALDSRLDAAIYGGQEARKKLAAMAGETYSVQTGAFLVETNARAYCEKMIEKGFDARVVLFKDAEKKTWYLVRCSRGLSLEDADRLEAELKNRHGITSIVRPEHLR